MAAIGDKFSRLAALKPTRPRPSGAELLRAPHAEDSLSHLLGAGIATNRYGQHVLVRNWFSSPEYSAISEVSLELLSRGRDEALQASRLAWMIHEGLGMMASRAPSQLWLDCRSR